MRQNQNNLQTAASFLALSLALFCSQPGKAQNLIVNSNFATGNFTGWTVTETGSAGDPGDFGVTNKNDGGFHVPYSGDTYGAYFNPRGGTMNLSQEVDIPVATNYTITAEVEPISNDPDTLTILLNGVSVFTTNFDFQQSYTAISVPVFAQAGPQEIDFQFSPGLGPMFFDDAGLVAPDSGSMITLLGMGLGGLAGFRRFVRN